MRRGHSGKGNLRSRAAVKAGNCEQPRLAEMTSAPGSNDLVQTGDARTVLLLFKIPQEKNK